MRRLLFFVTAILLTSNSFSQIDPETDCPAPETFFVGDYQISDVSAVIGPGNGTSNFEAGIVTISATGNTRTFQSGILPAFNVEIETINLRLNCSVIQIEDVNPSLQCNGVDAYLFTTTDEAGSTPYSLIDGDASFIINYIEDPLGSCGGPFISSFSLTKTCSAPQSLSFSNATDTTVDLNWEDTNNASTSTNTYTIEYGPQGFTPGNGQILTDIPVNSATVTNLQTNTAYDFYIFGSCSGSTSPVTGPFGYGNFVNPDFILDANGLTCLCPDADFGEEGTLLTNEGLKTFTKRTESELRALVDVNEFDPQIALTCTSGITNMSSLFDNKFSFNQSLEHWDVSNVTDMNFMFNNAGTFNQLLNMWDVSNVTNMSRMFSTASSFNQPLNNWDVSSVTDMSFMFIFVNVFNQPLNDWDVSNVTNMEQMFPGTSFNQPLDNWDVSQVTDMFAMFTQTPFNQPINNWDVSNVTDFGIMFRDTSYNLPLNNWDVSSATSLSGMFGNNPSFNQPLDNWNVSQVTNMSGMFQDATVFNQDISVWDVSQVTIMSRMFQGAAVFNQDISVWDVSQVTNMFSMFADAFDFNQPLDNWDVSNVTSMNNMFETSTAFNQDLSSWVFNPTANLTNFLSGSGLDTDNYDALLQSFDNQNLIGLALGADGVFYCDETTRNNLINDKNWTISGDSLGQCGITLNPSTTPFVTTWTVANPDLSIDIFTVDAWDYDFSVDWGDGTTDTNVTSTITHIYANPGTYTVSINGIFPYFKTCDILFGVANCTNSPKLTSVESWGDQEWRVMLGSFRTASNFNINTTAAPNISNVTSLEETFLDASGFNQNINNWDVSQVTDMTGTFREASSFNQPLDNWDVSQVRTMESAFYSASSFNQNINNWDVSSVTNMRFMFGTFGFLNSHAFNQPLNTWDVSGVTTMFGMFFNASDFNQALNDWDVGNVTNMSSMFGTADNFNQTLNNWDVSNVTNMSGMFQDAEVFNQDISVWDVSQVTNMFGMFQYATVFNQDISVWDVSQVTNMSRMFQGAAVFNQDISVWDVSQVTGMFQMFQGAAVFNQDLSIWCVEQIAEEPFDFATNSALQIDFFPDWGAVCDALSVNEENFASFKIYPNPVNDWLTVDLGNQTNATLTLHDVSGKRIQEQDITSTINVLDVSKLQSGLYLITINSEGKTTTQRFIKQ